VKKSITPTRFQSAVLEWRAHCNILNAGGRGSGKSFALILDLLAHCHDFGEDARPLVTRESHAGLIELIDTIYELCVAAWGPTVARNKHDGTISLPTGGTINFTNVGDETSYAKHQGKSYTALYADEVGNYPPTGYAFLRRIMSNLRCAPGRRTHIHMTANPHGRNHTAIYKEFVTKAPAWHPFTDDAGEFWLWTTSNLEDNPHIDQIDYRRKLSRACGGDKKLEEAWLRGDWSVLGGVMFDAFDPATHLIKAPPYMEAKYVIGADWGSAAPAVALLIAKLLSPLGRLRQGDFIILDEVNTADPSDLAVGLGHPPAAFAEMIQEMLARQGVKSPCLVIDDARGLTGDTVVNIMRECGLNARKPLRKDRIGTWNLIRQLLHNSKTGAEAAGIWFTDRCRYLLETLPEAPRGSLRAEDIDPKYNKDHALDALGYGLQFYIQNRIICGRTTGILF